MAIVAMPPSDPTQRFTNRVDAYVRYRPGYPAAVIDALQRQAGLGPASLVADIGAGTGIFTQLLLPHVAHVWAVEPNDAMRAAADQLLAGRPNTTRVNGTAEATTLPDHSVDLVTVAQAFHWFSPGETRREFARILRPQGAVALVWNERLADATPFLRDYEALLRRRATDYAEVATADRYTQSLTAFFGPRSFTLTEFPNEQRFDYAGLEGRLLSSSYAPPAGHPDHAPMLAELRALFDQHANGGQVSFAYRAKLYVGRL